jgi:hypothetical protein
MINFRENIVVPTDTNPTIRKLGYQLLFFWPRLTNAIKTIGWLNWDPHQLIMVQTSFSKTGFHTGATLPLSLPFPLPFGRPVSSRGRVAEG